VRETVGQVLEFGRQPCPAVISGGHGRNATWRICETYKGKRRVLIGEHALGRQSGRDLRRIIEKRGKNLRGPRSIGTKGQGHKRARLNEREETRKPRKNDRDVAHQTWKKKSVEECKIISLKGKRTAGPVKIGLGKRSDQAKIAPSMQKRRERRNKKNWKRRK